MKTGIIAGLNIQSNETARITINIPTISPEEKKGEPYFLTLEKLWRSYIKKNNITGNSIIEFVSDDGDALYSTELLKYDPKTVALAFCISYGSKEDADDLKSIMNESEINKAKDVNKIISKYGL